MPPVVSSGTKKNQNSFFAIMMFQIKKNFTSEYEFNSNKIYLELNDKKYYPTDSNTDLLYRTDSGESIDVIAEYFNSDAHSLTSYNNIFGNTVYKPQVIINPNVNSMGVFNKNVELELEHKNKTH